MMHLRNLALLLAALAISLALGISYTTDAESWQGAFGNRPKWVPRVERQRIAKEIARVRALLIEHRRANPERGESLRAPLRSLADLWRLQGGTPFPAVAERLGFALLGDKVLLDLKVDGGKQAGVREGLRIFGLQEQAVAEPEETVRVLASVPDLSRLAGLDGVRYLTAPRPMRLAALTEGAHATGADLWQNYTPLPGLPLGRPVKVAVVDGGFLGYADLRGTELPATVEIAAFCGASGGDLYSCIPLAPTAHGTAVAEIIHDMSPQAEMMLITFNLNEDPSRPGSTLRQALDFATSHGADIISMSVGTIWDNRDGRSVLCDTSESLAQKHVLWATSAGNDGDPCQHEHYAFRSSNVSPGSPYGVYQSFPKKSDPILNEIVLQPGQTHVVALTWNAWGRPPFDDFDLFYVCDYGSGYQLVDVSEDSQCGLPGSVPYEAVSAINSTGLPLACAYGVVEFDPVHCRHLAGGVQFDVWSQVSDALGSPNCADLEETTSSYTIAHPADCADTVAAGAVCVHGSGLEVYSSQGPTLDGRVKPNFCAPDAVSTQSFGPSAGCLADVGGIAAGFPGTSASTPHLAGALALLYEKIGGSFSLAQCRSILERRARDVNGDGTPDNQCGRGRLCLSGTGCD